MLAINTPPQTNVLFLVRYIRQPSDWRFYINLTKWCGNPKYSAIASLDMSDNSAYCLLSSSKAKRCASASKRMMDDDTETDRMNGVLACLCKTQWPSSWQSVYSCKFSSISSLRMIVLKRLFLTVRPQVSESNGMTSMSIFLSLAMRRASYVACARYSLSTSSPIVMASPQISFCIF